MPKGGKTNERVPDFLRTIHRIDCFDCHCLWLCSKRRPRPEKINGKRLDFSRIQAFFYFNVKYQQKRLQARLEALFSFSIHGERVLSCNYLALRCIFWASRCKNGRLRCKKSAFSCNSKKLEHYNRFTPIPCLFSTVYVTQSTP